MRIAENLRLLFNIFLEIACLMTFVTRFFLAISFKKSVS